MKKLNYKLIIISCIGFLFLSACNKEPEAFNYGVDICDHCKMTIVDTKWGSELITNKGKIYKFDVIECMINYMHEHKDINNNVHSLWTVDFLDNKKLIKAEDAVYVRSLSFHSPMGLNAVSLENEEQISQLNLEEPQPVNYNELIQIVNKEFGRK